MEIELHRESQNWRRASGRARKPLLPPLSLAQGTQRLAAEALKTAIKTPLMDGRVDGERKRVERGGWLKDRWRADLGGRAWADPSISLLSTVECVTSTSAGCYFLGKL